MNNDIKKKADANDAKGLKYIFVDALDVDPTFEVYAEEFEYCRKVNGFLEPHMELTPFKNDSSMWNENYWVKLKTDLLKNFSERRFSHMKQVAKVVKKEKLERLLKERARKQKETNTTAYEGVRNATNSANPNVNSTVRTLDNSEQLRRDIDASNRAYQEEQARIARTKAQLEAENKRVMEESESKKGLGVVLVLAVIVLLIILVVVI